MQKIIEFSQIIFLSLVVLHILIILILSFLLKIKPNILLEQNIRKNKLKVENIVYIVLLIFYFYISNTIRE